MATIDYKELYEQALAKAQELSFDGFLDAIAVTDIFPELKESEDERIKDRLINYFYGFLDGHEDTYKVGGHVKWEGLDVKDVIAWLEKQQKPEVDQHSLPVSDDSSLPTFDESIYHPCTEKAYEQKPTEWHREDEQNLNACLGYIPDELLRRWLMDAIHAKYDRPAWSEEDEEMLMMVIKSCEQCGNEYAYYWLKSLRPQNRWKPSDEQMDALHYVTNFDYGGHKATLVSLYEQLKKLKG